MLIGHQRIIQYLSKAAAADSLAHAYLFSGPESAGKMALAQEFAKFLQCSAAVSANSYAFSYCNQCKDCYDIDKRSHPDFLVIEPLNKDIVIGQIRNLIRTLGFKNYAAPYKIVIIDQAEKMTLEAANALLKTLEDPTPHSMIILVSAYPDALLSTIISRCQQIKFSLVSYQETEKGLLNYYQNEPSVLANIPEASRLSSGRPGVAIQIINNPGFIDKREEICRNFFEVIDSSLSNRYQYVSAIAPANTEEFLSVWLYILKDLIYLHFNKSSFILNAKFHKELRNLLNKYSFKKILFIINRVKEVKFLLRTTNVNKKLALETLMLEL